MTLERIGLYTREHWKLIGALVIMLVAAIVIGLLAAFCPPVLAAIAGFSVFGFTPFAALGVWATAGIGGLVAASFASAGIAAAVVALGACFFNLIYTITHAMDTAIIPKEDEYDLYELKEEDESSLDEVEGSGKKMADMGGKKAKNDGCGCFGDSKSDKSYESPLSKSKTKSGLDGSSPDGNDLDAPVSHSSAHLQS